MTTTSQKRSGHVTSTTTDNTFVVRLDHERDRFQGDGDGSGGMGFPMLRIAGLCEGILDPGQTKN